MELAVLKACDGPWTVGSLMVFVGLWNNEQGIHLGLRYGLLAICVRGLRLYTGTVQMCVVVYIFYDTFRLPCLKHSICPHKLARERG